MKSFVFTILVAAILAFEPSPVSAQVRPGGPPGQRQQRQQLEERLQQGFGRMVRNQLGLEAEEMASLQGVMQSFREDRQALSRDQASLRYRLRDPALPGMAEEDARAVLAEMVRVQEVELELYRREQAELLTVLNPRQLVQFYRIREDWGRGSSSFAGVAGKVDPADWEFPGAPLGGLGVREDRWIGGSFSPP